MSIYTSIGFFKSAHWFKLSIQSFDKKNRQLKKGNKIIHYQKVNMFSFVLSKWIYLERLKNYLLQMFVSIWFFLYSEASFQEKSPLEQNLTTPIPCKIIWLVYTNVAISLQLRMTLTVKHTHAHTYTHTRTRTFFVKGTYG